MGLAASQARFLQLTARRSNIEYQGQQINQQRLALANASAGLYQRQLTLVVPTPPSSSDDKFMTPSYDFTDPRDGVKKNIKFGYNDAMDTITSYTITYQKYNASGVMETVTNKSTDATPVFDLTQPALKITTTGIGDLSGATPGTWYMSTGTGNGANDTTVENSEYGPFGIDSTTGRLTGLILAQASTATTSMASTSQCVALTYSPSFDEISFNDAMNKYEYEKSTYDYEVERINTQTSEIQQKDKSLELKMKQLDTEHNAINTEMEAVQKVIQTNVTGSFKTFSS